MGINGCKWIFIAFGLLGKNGYNWISVPTRLGPSPITPEIRKLIAEIDEFKGRWKGMAASRLTEPFPTNPKECAVRLDPLCAKSSLFTTFQKGFRAGVVWR